MPQVDEFALKDAMICGSYMDDDEITMMAEELVAARKLISALRSDVGMNGGYITSPTLVALAEYEEKIR